MYVPLLASIEIQIATSNEENNEIAGNESGKDSQISPSILKLQSKCMVKLISLLHVSLNDANRN